MKIFNFEFFKRIGFYFSLASVATLLAAVFSYTYGFTGVLLEYNSPKVMTIALISIAVFAALLVFEPTSNYAPFALWIGVFVSFLAYIFNIYMYFTGIFYNGVSAEAFKLIDKTVLVSTIVIVIALITSNIAVYLRHSAEEEDFE